MKYLNKYFHNYLNKYFHNYLNNKYNILSMYTMNTLHTMIIHTLSTIPTYIFLPSIVLLYKVKYRIVHSILSRNSIYTSLGIDRQYYIIFNISKSIMLFFLSYLISIGYSENIITFSSIDWSRQIMFKNITSLYAITDFIPLFISQKKMMTSTVIHHVCVCMALLGVLSSDLENIGISNAIILYGLFSSFAFVVNFYLGIRFLISDDTLLRYIKRGTFINYSLSCICNWSLQSVYLSKYIYKLFVLYTQHHTQIHNYIYLLGYTGFLYFWIKDDLILMRYLLK